MKAESHNGDRWKVAYQSRKKRRRFSKIDEKILLRERVRAFFLIHNLDNGLQSVKIKIGRMPRVRIVDGNDTAALALREISSIFALVPATRSSEYIVGDFRTDISRRREKKNIYIHIYIYMYTSYTYT